MTSIGTALFTQLHGQLVGTDDQGNRYYTERKPAKGRRTKRWVIFQGKPDATTVPAEWYGWLHHTFDAPLSDGQKPAWQKSVQPNQTGTAGAYGPTGLDARGGQRQKAAGDYEAWTP